MLKSQGSKPTSLHAYETQNDGDGGKKPEPKEESWQYKVQPEPDRQPKAK